jgi:hypothetical protein
MFKETSCTLQWVKVVKNYKAQKFMNMHNAQKRKTLFINTMTSLSIHEKKHSGERIPRVYRLYRYLF